MSEHEFIDSVKVSGAIDQHLTVLEALEGGLTSTRIHDQHSPLAKAWRRAERIYGALMGPAIDGVLKELDKEANK